MPKHASPDERELLTNEVARWLDGRAARIFDGHVIVDFTDETGKIGGRVVHAADPSNVLLTFGIKITVS